MDFETLLAANRVVVERWVKFRVSGPDAEDILQETWGPQRSSDSL